MPPETEWALVADAQRARILERLVPLGRWAERAEDTVEIENPRSHEQGTERPGRSHESASSARHAIEPKSDPHRLAKQAFARRLAHRLEEAAQAGAYARLTLVAPPAFLGDLRDALGDAAQRRVRATLDSDLTHLPMHELAPRLDAIPRG
ncbi:host attachment protein [Falsiroseomonas oryzae]|uniref:host attachment protein n=1 Tax=Falsiroseomonas oryzae TaxID=2766473 RepID=UPI0022EA4A2B|nr:host attachment protein [Roseomonas sp. MO-31]